MKFSDYCDMIENTPEEQELLEFMRSDASMQEAWEVLEKMQNMPVLGKVITALGELPEYESLADFRASEHYPHLMNWDISFDAERGSFAVSPGPKHMLVFKCIVAAIGLGVLLLVVCRKMRKK